MLEAEVLTKPDSIENHFCKKFSALPKAPMDEQMYRFFVMLSLMNEGDLQEFKQETKIDTQFPVQMLKQRVKVRFNYIIDDKVVYYLSYQCDGNPGLLVMYATYLQYWCKTNNQKEVTWDNFSMKIFPMGFPKTRDLQDLWDEQKIKRTAGGSDNLIDYEYPATSIQF